jgi:mRNA-degrading endonuclease HigB of HigAB toxin-antitoxin module
MVLVGRGLVAKFAREYPPATTALAVWLSTVQQEVWRARSDVIGVFPAAKFVTPSVACFYLDAQWVITAQIAFNTGIVIVLAASVAGTVNESASRG